ncbi:hypothetical protein QJS10_CPB14g00074 [Acorus calamus]|uniref:DUF3730 domain-containing protein n=1 Tax=Acorus calamus TaxID=4465 RepID=A0AAV9DAT8_ACOCL|nr:hypothetical protein QJS10_CPB14g00074 [Acorus calamus]
MDPFSSLLERTRLPQPSLQRLAVASIFNNLRSSSSPGGSDAVHRCLLSTSPSVVDQAVRELCRLVEEGHATFDATCGLIALQSSLDGCDRRSVPVLVKAIDFICYHAFASDPSWMLRLSESPELHPYNKVLSCRADVHEELIRQAMLFIVRSRSSGLSRAAEFLRPFFVFSVLRIPFSDKSASFVRDLMSSVVSLACSLTPSEAVFVIELLMGCLKYFPRKNEEDLTLLVSCGGLLVDALVVITRKTVTIGESSDKVQLCGLALLEILLSICTAIHKPYDGCEVVIEHAKHLLLVQKELGLRYIPEYISILRSLFLILVQVEYEHEQLTLLKFSVFLLRWRNATEYSITGTTCGLIEELLFIFPALVLLSSPSQSLKAAATELLSLLETVLMDLLVERNSLPISQAEFPPISRPESIICRLLYNLWFQDQSSSSSTYFLSFSIDATSDLKGNYYESKSWISLVREYSLMVAERLKSHMASQSRQISSGPSGMPLLLSAIASALVTHHTFGVTAVDLLAVLGHVDLKVAMPLLIAVLYFNKIFCSVEHESPKIMLKLLELLPALASHSVMVPLIVQSISPMISKDSKPILYSAATRLLCKTWSVTDRAFGNLQGLLHPKALSESISRRGVCSVSIAASVRDICRQNPDRGVDLILSVSACIESQCPTVKALGFESLRHLCEADVVDFYTAWDVISIYVLDYSANPIVAYGLCNLLRCGAFDAEAYPEASKSVIQILWDVGTSRKSFCESKWVKARVSAFVSLTHYEVKHIQESISDLKERNLECLISEDNDEILKAMEGFQVKIITFEHINRRRLLKEKQIIMKKVEKLLDIFPHAMFSSGVSKSDFEGLPGTILLSHDLTPKHFQSQGVYKDLQNVHATYENALLQIGESLPLSRNILFALLAVQSWKPFMHRWMKAIVVLFEAKGPPSMKDKYSKAAADILKVMCRSAENCVPRAAENISLAFSALCMVLPPSATSVMPIASKFLRNWLFEFQHEHRQWTAAISLGLVSGFLHATDGAEKFEIISGLLKVVCIAKSSLVIGACGVGLGFSCQSLSERVIYSDGSAQEEEVTSPKEATLLGHVVSTLSSMICKLNPSSFDSLQFLQEYFPLSADYRMENEAPDLSLDSDDHLENDVWGVAGLILGLGYSVNAIYRSGVCDVVLKIKDVLISWIPHVNSLIQDPCTQKETCEIPLAVGSCLALPSVVAFCQKVDLMDNNIDILLNGFQSLISQILAVNKSGYLHQNLLMASCVGAGSFLSCILDEGVHSVKVDDINSLLEVIRKTYANPYPPMVQFGGMLGVVNAFGAGAATLTHSNTQSHSLQNYYEQKESSYVRGPILSSPYFEQFSTYLIQEMFQVAKDSKDQQLKRNAAWAISFLRQRWYAKEFQIVNNIRSSPTDSKSFPEDSLVWKLCLWLANLNSSEMDMITHVNTISTVLRCLSQSPRLPIMDWGAIIRRFMKYEDQVSSKLHENPSLKKGNLQEESIHLSFTRANQINPLLLFLDDITDLSRFRKLELNLQVYLLCHLADLIKVFSSARLEKLFDDFAEYFSSSPLSYLVRKPNQRSMLRVSCWKGLHQCLNGSPHDVEYITNLERCMEVLYHSLPQFPQKFSSIDEVMSSEEEWFLAVQCLSKAPYAWLIDFLQVHEMSFLNGEMDFVEVAKRISATSRLVKMGCIPTDDLGKLKPYILNIGAEGIWKILVEIVSALTCAEEKTKKQWLLDAVEICCITKYPSTTLRFIGLLSGSCCEYMPLLILDPVTVMSDLPVTLTSLLSGGSWSAIAESLVANLLASTERIYAWARQLENGNSVSSSDIDRSENHLSAFLVRVMHQACVSLKDYLPFEKQLRLANLTIL